MTVRGSSARRTSELGRALWVSTLLLACALSVPSGVYGQTYQGKVQRVIDGDTIHLLRETGQIVRLELYGVDAPERGQPYGDAAARMVRQFVHRALLRAVGRGRDEEGRPLFVISNDDVILNEELLRHGLAWWDRRRAPHADLYRRLEHEARTTGRGLCAHTNPVSPCTWRTERDDE